MLELGVPSYLIKATLVGVVAQRLVRVLCPHCKKASEVDAQMWKAVTAGWDVTVPRTIFEPVGCLSCRETGYKGRSGIYEIMPFTETLQPFADSAAELPKLRRQAFTEGMSSLRLSGARKAATGMTSLLEVLRVAPESS